MYKDHLQEILSCPNCKAELDYLNDLILCPACNSSYEIIDGKYIEKI